MDFTRTFIPSKYLLFVFALVLILVAAPALYALENSETINLEQEYQAITTRLYSVLAANISECRTRNDSLKNLNLQLKKLSNQNKNIIGICLIQNHAELLHKNIDNKEIFPVFQFLLENNNLPLANELYLRAKNEGDKSLVSNISFIYAQYYLKRKNWKKVLQYTKDIYTDLTANDASLAYIYTGIALQNVKKHREAVKIYLKVPRQSEHYPAARLNIATAYIRQDWWTDAHIKINEILNNKEIKANNEMNNRLYLVLGYSLLRKEFYRDSREAFRNIEINSVYFNKALLGIALTATNQEDYIGALNVIKILMSKERYDLSVDESYLLLPYIYEKLGQNMTASASYSDALKYYQSRIENLTTIKNKNSISAQGILNNSNHLVIENNIINYSQYFPISFLQNKVRIDELSKYTSHINNANLLKNFLALKEKYNNSLLNNLNIVFDSRLAYLESYMNQSRFGLARLFDNSNSASN
ncbi:MAG: hypothetical protein OQK75_07075 [Gammaproteobacteria bacterium]|nr:hypothetical protein [Gammaproteobacteria bacterium]